MLHQPANALAPAFAEALGVLVSLVSGCRGCVVHHVEGLRCARADPARAETWLIALESGPRCEVFDTRRRAPLAYVEQLIREPAKRAARDLQVLRDAGWDDGDILAINQVAACSSLRQVRRDWSGRGTGTRTALKPAAKAGPR